MRSPGAVRPFWWTAVDISVSFCGGGGHRQVNTIEYRVECQLLASLHAENVIPSRFPIGMEDQIRSWTAEDVKRFHREHYRPNNAVLYVVGDFGSTDDVEKEIERKFGRLENLPVTRDVAKGTLKETRSRHFPAVNHQWSNLTAPLSKPTDVRVFKHELLSSFSLHIYAKNPLQKVTSRQSFRYEKTRSPTQKHSEQEEGGDDHSLIRTPRKKKTPS